MDGRLSDPDTRYGRKTEAFVARYRTAMDDGHHARFVACEQVECGWGMPGDWPRACGRWPLARTQVAWAPWMGRKVMLATITIQKNWKAHSPGCANWRKCLSPVSNSEAYSNQRRGRDYYVRRREDLSEAFAYLQTLQRNKF